MNLDIKNIVSTYYSNNLDLFMEQGVLKAIELMDIWDCLSDIEKNNKRKAEIDYSKKHSLRSEKQQQYEELVIKIAGFIIDFIENTESRFTQVENIEGINNFLFRIRNLLFCELKLINRNISFKCINHVLPEMLEQIMENILNSNEYKEYRLDEFIFEYKKMFQLSQQNPYSEL